MDTREFTDAYGVDIVYDVHPAHGTPRGVVQLLHGVGEHAGRYGALIAALTGAGFHVYADDTAGTDAPASVSTADPRGSDAWARADCARPKRRSGS